MRHSNKIANTHFLRFFLVLSICRLSLITLSAQNLVPNGSFEEVIECPEFLAELDSDCAFWFQSIFDPEIEDWQNPSPDYYHMCSATENLSPPNTAFGFQDPRTGEAFAGIATYSVNDPNYREIIGVELSENLSVGSSYLVSFSVSRAHSPSIDLASSNIGVKFTTNNVFLEADLINNQADFYVDTLVTDTTNWVDLSFEFVADSAYQFLHIGNFFDDSNTSIDGSSQFGVVSYYYVDDVAISTIIGTQNLHYQDVTCTVYLNPSRDYLNIKCDEPGIEIIMIRILSLEGKILTSKAANGSVEENISMLGFATGNYIIEIETNKNTVYEKIIFY